MLASEPPDIFEINDSLLDIVYILAMDASSELKAAQIHY